MFLTFVCACFLTDVDGDGSLSRDELVAMLSEMPREMVRMTRPGGNSCFELMGVMLVGFHRLRSR